MNEFERIEYLMSEKPLEDWTDEERKFIAEHMAPEEIEALTNGIHDMRSERRPLDAGVKRQLLSRFRSKKSLTQRVFMWKVPAYTLVPIVVLLFFVIRWGYPPPVQDRIVERVVERIQLDTVRITEIDTLWVERMVEVPVLVEVSPTEGELTSNTSSPGNKALADKRELLDLVIRGDD